MTQDRILTFAAGILLPATIFAAAPFSFIALNSVEFPPSRLFIQSLMAVFSVWCIGAWILSAYDAKSKIQKLVLKSYYAISLLVFVFYMVPKPFTGDFSYYTISIYGDVLIIFAVFVLCVCFSANVIRKVIFVGVLMLAADVVSNYVDLRSVRKPEVIMATAQETSEEPENLPGNVYFILLDAFPGDALPPLIKSMPDLDLDGFTYFADSNSVSWSTAKSLPVFFSGKSYDGISSLNEWENAAFRQENFWRHATREISGLKRHSQDLGKFKETLKEGSAYNSGIDDFVIIDFSFLKLLPYSLFVFLNENYADKDLNLTHWSYGFSILSSLFGDAIQAPNSQPFYAALHFKDYMINKEPSRAARGQFVYLHSMLSHAPYELNEKCQVLESGDISASVAASKQYTCTTRLVARFIQRLKDLGRFDDSMILIVSDHGAFHLTPHSLLTTLGNDLVRIPPDSPEERQAAEKAFFDAKVDSLEKLDMENLPSPVVDIGVASLMLIKPANGKGFNIVNTPRNIRQIAPTILAHYGLENTLNEHVSVFEEQPFPVEENVVQLTVHSNLSKYRHEDIFQYSKNNREGKWRFVGRMKALKDHESPTHMTISTDQPSASVAKFSSDRAFDHKESSFWEAGGPDFSFPIWVQVEFNAGQNVSGYSITAGPFGDTSVERMPRKWQLMGSADGQHWVTLDRQELFEPFGNRERRYFALERQAEYIYYRIVVYEGFSADVLRLYDVELDITD